MFSALRDLSRARVVARGLFVFALLMGQAASARAEESILLIGNSFTGGIKARLRAIVRSSGHEAGVSVRAANGWTLDAHAASARTLRKLAARPWTHVVLQEQSDGEFEERYPAARALDAEVDAIGGETVFFMTWRDRGADISEYDDLLGEPGGTMGYVPIASELYAPLSPIGWVFRELLLEEPDAELWGPDGHHASERGRYLAALTLFATIYGESPVGLWATPLLTEAQALHDQQLVERIVIDGASQWNFD